MSSGFFLFTLSKVFMHWVYCICLFGAIICDLGFVSVYLGFSYLIWVFYLHGVKVFMQLYMFWSMSCFLVHLGLSYVIWGFYI